MNDFPVGTTFGRSPAEALARVAAALPNVEIVDPGASSAKRRHKYGAQPTTVGNIRFDSKREAARWAELKLLETAGAITGLRRQVRFGLTVNGELVGAYTADFVYAKDGRRVVEDTKSEATRKIAVYRLKKKLMLACHGIEIQEV